MKHGMLLAGVTLASLFLPEKLTAQSNDPMRDCRRQASVATDANMSEISVRRDQEMNNGGYRLAWDARRNNGRTTSGFCEVNRRGRVIRFEQTTGVGGGGNLNPGNGNWNPGGGQGTSSIQANITGGSGDGKCTFEVEVDGVAEVEVQGDRGILRTMSGAPARWRRLDCNQPLPRNARDFRFKGIDGRGSQDLVRDPNSNRGRAVVRLEDPKGGSEGYTGDLIWRN